MTAFYGRHDSFKVGSMIFKVPINKPEFLEKYGSRNISACLHLPGKQIDNGRRHANNRMRFQGSRYNSAKPWASIA